MTPCSNDLVRGPELGLLLRCVEGLTCLYCNGRRARCAFAGSGESVVERARPPVIVFIRHWVGRGEDSFTPLQHVRDISGWRKIR